MVKIAAGNSYSILMRNEDIIAKPLAGLQPITGPLDIPVVRPVSTRPTALTPRPKSAEPVIVKAATQQVIAPARAGLPAEVQASEPQVKATAKCGTVTLGSQTGVCTKENLAIFDRIVASSYRQSLAYADARKRAELLQTDGSLIRRRELCRTDSCLLGIYLLRLREIADIMKSMPKLTR